MNILLADLAEASKFMTGPFRFYRVFSHDVTTAILVSQTNPLGIELFSYANASFVPINLHRCWPRELKHSIS